MKPSRLLFKYLVISGFLAIALFLNHEKSRQSTLWESYVEAPHVLSLVLVVVVIAASLWLIIQILRERTTRTLTKVLFSFLSVILILASSLVALAALANMLALSKSHQLRAESSVKDGTMYITGHLGHSLVHEVEVLLTEHAVDMVVMNSPGGSNDTAKTLAAKFNSHGLTIRIDHVCASACVLLWARTSKRELHRHARVGLHSMQDAMGGQSTGSALVKLWNDAYMTDLMSIGFPREILQEAMRDPVTWLSGYDIEELGVNAVYLGD